MYNSLLMHIIDRLKDLSDESRRVLFRVRSLLDDSIEEFTASYSASVTKEKGNR